VLQHYDKTVGAWVPATNPVYTPAPPNDTAVCGTFTSLSPFALMAVTDHTPPAVTCSVAPDVLWPPDGRMVPVTARVQVSDAGSGPAGFTLTAVTSSETGGSDDMQGFAIGTADTTGLLRAARLGAGAGRMYTLTFTGRDVAGNTAACSATVSVPHDRRR
jgi:hypothetical protein